MITGLVIVGLQKNKVYLLSNFQMLGKTKGRKCTELKEITAQRKG